VIEMTGLTFDWDDASLDDELVQSGLKLLTTLFPIENIWVRVSSSKTGLHVMIGELLWNTFLGESILTPIKMSVEDQMRYRHQFVDFGLECSGRLISDTVRQSTTLQTSRVFGIKNGNRSEAWLPCVEVLNT
tara:strand:+ start:3845 stop:4240 length:396 start_codon:yes stop_codon:yes gene_type:complete